MNLLPSVDNLLPIVVREETNTVEGFDILIWDIGFAEYRADGLLRFRREILEKGCEDTAIGKMTDGFIEGVGEPPGTLFQPFLK